MPPHYQNHMQRWKFHHENQEKREESVFFSITGSFSQAICREISYKTYSKKKQAAIIKNPYLTLKQVISKTLSFKKNPLRRFIKFQDQIFC